MIKKNTNHVFRARPALDPRYRYGSDFRIMTVDRIKSGGSGEIMVVQYGKGAVRVQRALELLY